MKKSKAVLFLLIILIAPGCTSYGKVFAKKALGLIGYIATGDASEDGKEALEKYRELKEEVKELKEKREAESQKRIEELEKAIKELKAAGEK